VNKTEKQAIQSEPQERLAIDFCDTTWNFASWLTSEDNYSDAILSSRVRLARNLKGYRFPHRASNVELKTVMNRVSSACEKCPSLEKARSLDIQNLSDLECKYFVERRLASPQLIENNLPSLLILSEPEDLSLMVNEEDHLRLQCIEAGLGINAGWKKITKLDDELEGNLELSYSKKFGYLTSCLTNIGTGLRVSVFVHLPGLSLEDKIDNVLERLPDSEIAVRGFYGEGTESIGNIYQISNQPTLGRTETSIIERITQTALQLVELERGARERLLDNNRTKLEDAVFRAIGVLKNARIISSLESMNLLSTLRFGCELGMLKDISRLTISQLIVLVQPGHLQRIYQRPLKPSERDVLRAEFIRQNLVV